MGVCETIHKDKNVINEGKEIKKSKTQNFLEANNYNYNSEIIKIDKVSSKCPKLEKYNKSFEKKSEVNNSFRSEKSSKIEEVIIKGEINKECENKEKDFNNNSFMKLIERNGGIILKEKKDSKYLFKDDDISEIQSKSSFASSNNGSINSTMKMIKFYRNNNKYQQSLNNTLHSYNEYNSFYSTKTNKPRKNPKNYLNKTFNIQDNDESKRKKRNDRNKNRILISNYNTMSSETTNEDLVGSNISIPKNDDRISESELQYDDNIEIISILSSE